MKAFETHLISKKKNLLSFLLMNNIVLGLLHITKLDRGICADIKGPETCKQMINETTCYGRSSAIRKTKRECKKSCGICQ